MNPKSIILLLLLITSQAFCQVGINPPAVFIDPSTGSGMVTIINKGKETVEVGLAFRFAYQAYDSSGKKYIVYDDSTSIPNHSLLPYLMAYPRKFRLGPGAESVARLLVSGDDSLPDGAYWSRLIISSRQTSHTPDSSHSPDGSLRPGFDLLSQVVGIVVFNKGLVTSNLDISGASASGDSSHVFIDLYLSPSGNSPFWGNIEISLTDDSGNTLANSKEILAVYLPSRKRFSFDRSLFTPGKSISALVSVDNRHKDIPASVISGKIQFSRSFIFTLN